MSFEIQPVTGTRKRSFHSEPRAHTGATKGPADFLCLLCFPPRRFSSQSRRPQNGSASTGKLHYFNVCCGKASNRNWFAGSFGTLRGLPFCTFRPVCARIPPIRRNLNDEAFFCRFPLSARAYPVRFGTDEVGYEENRRGPG